MRQRHEIPHFCEGTLIKFFLESADGCIGYGVRPFISRLCGYTALFKSRRLRGWTHAGSFILLSFSILLHCSSLEEPCASCDYPDSYCKGMNVFFMPPRNAFSKSDFNESLSRLKKDGITDLFLIPYYFSNDEHSDSIFPTAQTISDSELVEAIRLSRYSGFSVALKPQIDLLNGIPRYRIVPGNIKKWTEQYAAFIKKYIAISVATGLNRFVIGTELDHVSETDEFIRIVSQARSMFSGQILYAASFDHAINATIWKYVDAIGVDAYFNLDNGSHYSINTLMDSWNYWLDVMSAISSNYGKPIILTEVGYVSRDGATKNPGSWEKSASYNGQVQADCYKALLSQACSCKKIIGIFWWQWELHGIGGVNNIDYTPRDKPAEQVIRDYWAR